MKNDFGTSNMFLDFYLLFRLASILFQILNFIRQQIMQTKSSGFTLATTLAASERLNSAG